jgi:hypothetical protein
MLVYVTIFPKQRRANINVAREESGNERALLFEWQLLAR